VSIRQLNLVWEHSKQKGGALLMMLAIADFADDAGAAYPGVETLARKSRMSERNARYVLRELEACGEISVEQNAGPKGSNLYRIKLTPNLELFGKGERGATVAAGAKVAPGAGGDKEGGKTRQKGGQPIAPEPSLTIKEPSGIYTPPAAVLDWAVKGGFSPWLDLHLEHFRDYIAQPKNRRRYADLDAAFRSCVRADWGDVRFKAQMAAKRGERVGVPAPGAGEWWKTTQGVKAMAAQLGVEYVEDENVAGWVNFLRMKARVCVAAGDGPWMHDKDDTFQRFLRAAREAVPA
jgi:hypothetical protein